MLIYTCIGPLLLGLIVSPDLKNLSNGGSVNDTDTVMKNIKSTSLAWELMSYLLVIGYGIYAVYAALNPNDDLSNKIMKVMPNNISSFLQQYALYIIGALSLVLCVVVRFQHIAFNKKINRIINDNIIVDVSSEIMS